MTWLRSLISPSRQPDAISPESASLAKQERQLLAEYRRGQRLCRTATHRLIMDLVALEEVISAGTDEGKARI